jgi:CRISPR-associated protein Cmr3
MSTLLDLTPHDPLIARDGRPFGAGQGNRMRGLPWPLPSVVAGSFRTALVKATGGDFSGDVPQRLMAEVAVAGVLPAHNGGLYLPAPLDGAWHKETKTLFRAAPQTIDEGCGTDLPDGLRPVMLSPEQAADDFKAETPPAWWPLAKSVEWLTGSADRYEPGWITNDFLLAPRPAMRDHVALDADRGAAAEGQIFATANLHVTHLPRYRAQHDDTKAKFSDRYAEVTLSARVSIQHGSPLALPSPFATWHPLGGERRLVHWQQCQQSVTGWDCPDEIRVALANTECVRLILATPAIFRQGWQPNLVNGPLKDIGLTLVAACIGRWKAVSGWALAATKDQPRGPKPIRRMVPAGSVYFFTCEKKAAAQLPDHWLKPVSDTVQDQRDGFGLALWGTW